MIAMVSTYLMDGVRYLDANGFDTLAFTTGKWTLEGNFLNN